MAASLATGDRFRIAPSVRSRQVDDELVLVDLRGGEYFSLNPSGAAVWHGIERGLTFGDLGESVAADWPVDPAERRRMLTAIIEDFLARGLVEVER